MKKFISDLTWYIPPLLALHFVFYPKHVRQWVLRNYNAGDYIKIHDAAEMAMTVCKGLGIFSATMILVSFNIDIKISELTVHKAVLYGFITLTPVLVAQKIHNIFKRIMKSVEKEAAEKTISNWKKEEK